jgi:WD40 repeat protein
MIWDADSGQALQVLFGHSDRVFKVAFSPDGARLATASADGTARVWDAASGEELLALVGHVGGVYGVVYSPDGAHLATAGEDGTVRRYVFDAEELLELARTRVTRPWRPEECQKYLHRKECPAMP